VLRVFDEVSGGLSVVTNVAKNLKMNHPTPIMKQGASMVWGGMNFSLLAYHASE
jgi:hypothetical protein